LLLILSRAKAKPRRVSKDPRRLCKPGN